MSYSSQNLEENDTVYMLMTDRFFDGNSSNNGTFNEEYRPGDLHYYQGGDWAGLTQKLQYIKDMGFTAIWISAPQKTKHTAVPATRQDITVTTQRISTAPILTSVPKQNYARLWPLRMRCS